MKTTLLLLTAFLCHLPKSSPIAGNIKNFIESPVKPTFTRIKLSLDVKNGSHYINFYAGIPLQTFSLLMDTASSITAVSCRECETCRSQTNAHYNVEGSTSGSHVSCGEYGSCASCEHDQCQVKQRYSDGSFWEAVVIQDSVWLGSALSRPDDRMEAMMRRYGVRYPFACQTLEGGTSLYQRGDGLLGLGRENASLLNYMLQAERIERNMFSLCLHELGGYLMLGGYDPDLHSSSIKYTKMMDVTISQSSYAVQLKDIRINGKSIGDIAVGNASRPNMILNTASTTTLFPSATIASFKKLYRKVSGIDFENQMNLLDKSVFKLPMITVVIASEGNDIELMVPAQTYLTAQDKAYVSQIQFSQTDEAALGSALLLQYDVIFDLKRQQIGFASAACDYRGNSSAAIPFAEKKVVQTSQLALKAAPSNDTKSSRYVHIISIGTFVLVIALLVWKNSSKETWLAVKSSDHTEDASISGQSIHRQSMKTAISSNGILQDISISTSSSQEETETMLTLDSLMQSRVLSPRFVIGDIEEEEDESLTI